jgi:CHASE3 domain sensor protein
MELETKLLLGFIVFLVACLVVLAVVLYRLEESVGVCEKSSYEVDPLAHLDGEDRL